ncbi:hypothetical protein scyTo_0001895 [Scyliorhinus torazame]|uniref:Uncharacterized protein n=1 Tax=Scyliorhinus torazame TaxID=75743 RepID=A0A401PGJ5_SCYTO|nr:hypothetical protein [Scyliorhinus torazame]
MRLFASPFLGAVYEVRRCEQKAVASCDPGFGRKPLQNVEVSIVTLPRLGSVLAKLRINGYTSPFWERSSFNFPDSSGVCYLELTLRPEHPGCYSCTFWNITLCRKLPSWIRVETACLR